jgi:putative restriction endonuclease
MSFIKKILKKIMPQQNYEEYWKITLEYTDFNDVKFLKTLQMVVDKIDELNANGAYVYNSNDNKALQQAVLKEFPKGIGVSEINRLGSTRKAINQCVKLGFVNPELKSYHSLTKEYLSAKSNKKREKLFSKIVYSNSKFNRSTKKGTDDNQINFLIKTLEEVGVLTKKDVYALMLIDIQNHKKNYATIQELKEKRGIADNIGFLNRKYNQYGYLINVLGKLEGIVFVRKSNKDFELYFEEDAKRIYGEDLEQESKKRDPYLHLLYKKELYEESKEKYHNEKTCYFEKRIYPVVIASHIKPFIESEEDEAYDPNNGLLLSPTIDSLFDGRKVKPPYLSFNDDGSIIFSERLDENVKEFWKDYSLEENILNDKRKEYLAYHRNLMIESDANA